LGERGGKDKGGKKRGKRKEEKEEVPRPTVHHTSGYEGRKTRKIGIDQ